MSDREQFILRHAVKFDDMVKNEFGMGMSANKALKAFSEGSLKSNNIDQQLASAHREGWEQAKREMAQEVDMEGGIKYKPCSWEQQALYKAANRIRAMEYKGAEKTV